MARDKNNGRGTARGGLFGRAGRSGATGSGQKKSGNDLSSYESIDLSAADAENADIDVDLSELLKKYMPEAEDGESDGILSVLKSGDAASDDKAGVSAGTDAVDELGGAFSLFADRLTAEVSDAESEGSTQYADGVSSANDGAGVEDGNGSALSRFARRLDSVITEYDIDETSAEGQEETAKASEPVRRGKTENAFSDLELDVPAERPDAASVKNDGRGDRKAAKEAAKEAARRAKEEKKAKKRGRDSSDSHPTDISKSSEAERTVPVMKTAPVVSEAVGEARNDADDISGFADELISSLNRAMGTEDEAPEPRKTGLDALMTEDGADTADTDDAFAAVNDDDFEEPSKTKPSLFVDDFSSDSIDSGSDGKANGSDRDPNLDKVLTGDELMMAAAMTLAADAEAAGKAAAEMVQQMPQNTDSVPVTEDGGSDTKTAIPTELMSDSFADRIASGADGARDADRKKRKSGKAENAAEADEAAADDDDDTDEDIDPTDLNLMVVLGLDKEDGGKNAKRAKEIGDMLESNAKKENRKKRVLLNRSEFVDKAQAESLNIEFKKRRAINWTRFAISLILTLGLLVYENIEAITKLFIGEAKQFTGIIDPAVYPVVYIMVSLQIMLLVALCAYDEIMSGFANIFRGTPRPESLTSVMVIAGVLYSAVAASFSIPAVKPKVFNFVPAFACLLTVIYAMFNAKREYLNFTVVADRRGKHIVRRLTDLESEGETKAYADRDDVCDVMKIERTNFVQGFFTRLQKPNQTTTTFMSVAVWIPVLIAVLCGVAMGFKDKSASDVAATVFSAYLVLSPVSVFFTFAYPFYRANVIAKKRESAIIGETSLEEYSNASIISFDDKNIFPSDKVKVSNIRIYNNARFDRVLYYASSVFSYAGGPLKDVFEVATKELGNSKNVSIIDSGYGYLVAEVDHKEVCFGSYDVLKANGYDIPDEARMDDVDLSNEIMFVFLREKLVAKMYIKYEVDSDVESILRQFANSNLYVCVRTFDPNINEEMIARSLQLKKMPLKIVPYTKSDDIAGYREKAESGLVTCGSPKNLLYIISYCGRVLRTKKTDIAISILSIFIGSAILALLFFADSFGILTSLLIVLYQLVWCIPTIITSRVYVR